MEEVSSAIQRHLGKLQMTVKTHRQGVEMIAIV